MASDGSQPWAGGGGTAFARLPGHGGQQPSQNYGQLRAAEAAPAKGGYGKHGDYDPAAQPGNAVYAQTAAHPHGGYVPSGPIGRFMAPAYVPPSQRPAAAAAAAPAAAGKHGTWTERGTGTWYAPPSTGNKKMQFKASRAITAAAPLSAPRVYDPRAERRYAMLRDGSKMPLLAVPVARPADAAARLDEGWDHLDVTPLLGRAAAAGADGERVDLGGRDRGSFFAYASCGLGSAAGAAGEGPGPAEVGALPAALGVAALDLALLHKPPAVDVDAAGFAQLFLDAWQALEALVEAGRVTTLGLGGFDERELAAVLPLCKVRPAVLQAELHPLHSQRRLAGFCRRQGIELMSCAPLAGGAPELLEEPAVREVAAAHGVSAEVAALKYCVHRGIAALVPAAAAAEARQVWTFGLVGAEKAALDKLDRQRAFCACCHKQ